MPDFPGPERRWQPSRDEIEGMMDAVAKKSSRLAVRETFVSLGIDIDNAEDLRRWHAERQFLQEQLERHEQRHAAGVQAKAAAGPGLRNGAIAAILGAAGAWFVQNFKWGH